MSKLSLKVNGLPKDVLIKIDNKKVKLKKNSFGNLGCEYSTDNQNVKITLQKFLEINNKFWWLWQIVYFVISIFGIFDYRLDKQCYVIDCEFDVQVSENTTLTLRYDGKTGKEKALQIETDANVTEIKNQFYVDENAKKRMKKLKFIKLATFFCEALIIVLLILLFIK